MIQERDRDPPLDACQAGNSNNSFKLTIMQGFYHYRQE